MDWRDEMTFPSNTGEIGGGGGSNFHGYGGGSAAAQEGGLHAPPVSNPNIHTDTGMINTVVMEKKKRGRPRKYGPPPPLRDGAEKPRIGRPPGTGWKQKLARLYMSAMECQSFSPVFSPEPNMTAGENCRKRKQGEYPCAPLPQPPHSAVSHPGWSETPLFFQKHRNEEEYVIAVSDDDDNESYEPLPENRTATLDKRSRAHEIGGERSPGEDEDMIDAIKAKHGNIDEDCIMKSESVRKTSLVFICNVLKDLQKKSLEELEVASLENYYEVVRDVEKLNIDVKWLLERLDEIKDAITSRDEKTEWTKKLEEKRREMERLANENRILEGHVERLNNSVSNGTYKFQKFQNMPHLMDGLI